MVPLGLWVLSSSVAIPNKVHGDAELTERRRWPIEAVLSSAREHRDSHGFEIVPQISRRTENRGPFILTFDQHDHISEKALAQPGRHDGLHSREQGRSCIPGSP